MTNQNIFSLLFVYLKNNYDLCLMIKYKADFSLQDLEEVLREFRQQGIEDTQPMWFIGSKEQIEKTQREYDKEMRRLVKAYIERNDRI